MRERLLNLIGDASLSGGSSLPPSLLTNLVAWWKFDEASGTRINSVVANNALDLTPMNGLSTIAGKIGNSVDFTSSTQYLTCAGNPLLSPLGNGNFSIHFWIKWDADTGLNYVFGQGNGNYDFIFGLSNSFFQIALNSGSSGGGAAITPLGLGVWHNAVVTVNRSTNTSILYINGIADPNVGTATFGTVYGGPLIIGNYAGGSLNYAPDGAMDEVAHWDRVLSPAEVTTLYNGGAGLTF